MVEKNTRICDVCDVHVAKWQCEICSKDICENCTNEISLNLDGESNLFDINTCEKCKKQFVRVCLSEETIFEDVMKDKPELKNEIVELIKNILMLKKISDEDLKKEEENEPPFTFPNNILPNNYPNSVPRHIRPRKPYPYTPYYDKKLKKSLYEQSKKKTWWGGIR